MHLNMNGRVNGGAIMAFADVLGALGAVANRPPGYRGGTIESKTNFFASGVGPVLSAVCVPSAHRPHDVGVADDDSERRRLEGRHGHSDADFGPGEGARSRIVTREEDEGSYAVLVTRASTRLAISSGV